jgi:hypothetical protein
MAEARAALGALQTEAASLRLLVQGERPAAVVRHEQHQVVRPSGAVEVVQIDTPTIETQYVSALERLKARRRLAVVEDDLALAEQVLEEARAAGGGRRAGDPGGVGRRGPGGGPRDLPRLVRETRRVQREWQQFQARCATLDQRLAQARFTEAAWGFVMAPGAQFDAFVAHCLASYGLNLD